MWKIELKKEIFDNLYAYLMEKIIFLNKKSNLIFFVSI